MSAVILYFPGCAAEPPVDPEETLDAALRRHCLALLADSFGLRFADAIAVLGEPRSAEEAIGAVAELERLEAETAGRDLLAGLVSPLAVEGGAR